MTSIAQQISDQGTKIGCDFEKRILDSGQNWKARPISLDAVRANIESAYIETQASVWSVDRDADAGLLVE